MVQRARGGRFLRRRRWMPAGGGGRGGAAAGSIEVSEGSEVPGALVGSLTPPPAPFVVVVGEEVEVEGGCSAPAIPFFSPPAASLRACFVALAAFLLESTSGDTPPATAEAAAVRPLPAAPSRAAPCCCSPEEEPAATTAPEAAAPPAFRAPETLETAASVLFLKRSFFAADATGDRGLQPRLVLHGVDGDARRDLPGVGAELGESGVGGVELGGEGGLLEGDLEEFFFFFRKSGFFFFLSEREVFFFSSFLLLLFWSRGERQKKKNSHLLLDAEELGLRVREQGRGVELCVSDGFAGGGEWRVEWSGGR